MIKTEFQDIYGTRVPIVQAGMGPYDTESLCIAVAKAGGLGLISTVGMGSFEMPGIGTFRYSAIFDEKRPRALLESAIKNVYEAIKDDEDVKFGVNIPVSAEFVSTASELIQTVIDMVKTNPEIAKHLVAIFTSAGDPLPWSTNPGEKKHDRSISIKSECPDLVWTHVVPSVRAAKRCVKADVDVIVASGRDGGAHCSWRDTSSMVLIPEVIENVKKPIIAAGGFADGKTFAAALAFGAIGVQMGTRFIATQESSFEQSWKESLVKATEEDSIVARGFFGPMRFIRNTQGLKLTDATIEGAPDLYKGIPCGSTDRIIDLEVKGLENLWDGDAENSPLLSGMVAGRIHEIPTVKELMDAIMIEAETIITNLKSTIN